MNNLFKFQSEHDPIITEGNRCSYCGSLSPFDVMTLLKTKGTKFEGADQKYGYPHKFYLNNAKFYTTHLEQLDDEKLKEFSELSQSCFGITWKRKDGKIHYQQPRNESFHGWQMYGVIDSNGKPDHSLMKNQDEKIF